MKACYLYIIKDSFFKRFDDPNLKGNKSEKRPHYYCFNDDVSGLYWIIPLSSRVEKYKSIIAEKQKRGKPTDGIHICKLISGKEDVFLIQDMFPITEEYVLRPYTIAGRHMCLVREADKKIIDKKAKRILNLIKRNQNFMPNQVDTEKIKKELLKDLGK